MKKLHLVFVLIFCLLSFNTAQAKTTPIYLKPVDNRAENIEKAREKLDKDNETNYKRLQDQLKSISASINTNQSISAQEEYQYQLQVYELKSEIACKNKEGYYSSFNKNTKECQCEEGSTFINGKCENELRLHLNNLLMCVKSFGPLSHYNYEESGCACDEGNEFDWDNNGLCTAKTEKIPTNIKEKTTSKNPFLAILQEKDTHKVNTENADKVEPPKTSRGLTESQKRIIPILEEKVPSQAEITPNTSHDTLSTIGPIEKSATFWQKLKNGILKIKFW